MVYVKISDGETKAPAPPKSITLPFSKPAGDRIVTEERTFKVGEAGYKEAVNRWMYLNGYMPQQSGSVKVSIRS
jgi:hypothetical protein